MLLGDGKADGHGEALAEGAGGDLDAGGFAVLRVARGVGAPLAELGELLDGQTIAGEVEDAVEQGGRVAVREHEAVAIGPERVRGVVLHQLVVEQVGDGSAAERGAGVAGFGGLDGVDGEKAEGVDGKLFEFGGWYRSLCSLPLVLPGLSFFGSDLDSCLVWPGDRVFTVGVQTGESHAVQRHVHALKKPGRSPVFGASPQCTRGREKECAEVNFAVRRAAALRKRAL